MKLTHTPLGGRGRSACLVTAAQLLEQLLAARRAAEQSRTASGNAGAADDAAGVRGSSGSDPPSREGEAASAPLLPPTPPPAGVLQGRLHAALARRPAASPHDAESALSGIQERGAAAVDELGRVWHPAVTGQRQRQRQQQQQHQHQLQQKEKQRQQDAAQADGTCEQGAAWDAPSVLATLRERLRTGVFAIEPAAQPSAAARGNSGCSGGGGSGRGGGRDGGSNGGGSASSGGAPLTAGGAQAGSLAALRRVLAHLAPASAAALQQPAQRISLTAEPESFAATRQGAGRAADAAQGEADVQQALEVSSNWAYTRAVASGSGAADGVDPSQNAAAAAAGRRGQTMAPALEPGNIARLLNAALAPTEAQHALQLAADGEPEAPPLPWSAALVADARGRGCLHATAALAPLAPRPCTQLLFMPTRERHAALARAAPPAQPLHQQQKGHQQQEWQEWQEQAPQLALPGAPQHPQQSDRLIEGISEDGSIIYLGPGGPRRPRWREQAPWWPRPRTAPYQPVQRHVPHQPGGTLALEDVVALASRSSSSMCGSGGGQAIRLSLLAMAAGGALRIAAAADSDVMSSAASSHLAWESRLVRSCSMDAAPLPAAKAAVGAGMLPASAWPQHPLGEARALLGAAVAAEQRSGHGAMPEVLRRIAAASSAREAADVLHEFGHHFNGACVAATAGRLAELCSRCHRPAERAAAAVPVAELLELAAARCELAGGAEPAAASVLAALAVPHQRLMAAGGGGALASLAGALEAAAEADMLPLPLLVPVTVAVGAAVHGQYNDSSGGLTKRLYSLLRRKAIAQLTALPGVHAQLLPAAASTAASQRGSRGRPPAQPPVQGLLQLIGLAAGVPHATSRLQMLDADGSHGGADAPAAVAAAAVWGVHTTPPPRRRWPQDGELMAAAAAQLTRRAAALPHAEALVLLEHLWGPDLALLPTSSQPAAAAAAPAALALASRVAQALPLLPPRAALLLAKHLACGQQPDVALAKLIANKTLAWASGGDVWEVSTLSALSLLVNTWQQHDVYNTAAFEAAAAAITATLHAARTPSSNKHCTAPQPPSLAAAAATQRRGAAARLRPLGTAELLYSFALTRHLSPPLLEEGAAWLSWVARLGGAAAAARVSPHALEDQHQGQGQAQTLSVISAGRSRSSSGAGVGAHIGAAGADAASAHAASPSASAGSRAMAAPNKARVSPVALCKAAWFLATFGHGPPHAAAALTSAGTALMPRFTLQHAGWLGWAAAVLDMRDVGFWRSLNAAVRARAVAEGASQPDHVLHQLLQAQCHAAVFVDGAFALPPALLARARSVWRDSKESPYVSQLQRTVYHAFKPLVKVDHVELEFKSAAANYTSIDMLVRHKGAALALEVDGPWHFTANTPYRRLGGTQLRDRLLEAEGYTVVSLPFHEWEALRSDAERSAYLQHLIDSATVTTGDGRHRSRGDGSGSGSSGGGGRGHGAGRPMASALAART